MAIALMMIRADEFQSGIRRLVPNIFLAIRGFVAYPSGHISPVNLSYRRMLLALVDSCDSQYNLSELEMPLSLVVPHIVQFKAAAAAQLPRTHVLGQEATSMSLGFMDDLRCEAGHFGWDIATGLIHLLRRSPISL
jgi:hypothetical protein